MSTILIIEDNPAVLEIMVFVLRDSYTVIEASNGEDGLLLYEQYHPDLIITDIVMPYLSGLELVRQIRATDTKVKIIAHGSFFYSGGQAAMLEAGVDLCLQKPIGIAEIERAVAELLGMEPSIGR